MAPGALALVLGLSLVINAVWSEEQDVNGGWSNWSSYSPCSALRSITSASGGDNYHQMTERLCNNPSPQGAGRQCTGPSVMTTLCKPDLVEDLTRNGISKTKMAHVVGGVGGEELVTNQGSFHYSIPLRVPPGTRSFQPNLELTYSSLDEGELILGRGFRLGGLVHVTCCPSSFGQKDFREKCESFCLGGERLVAVKGKYGENGTNYFTEIDSFSRIVSYISIDDLKLWFKCWLRNGEVLYFGYSRNSRVNRSNNSDGEEMTVLWALSKREDPFGNAVSYRYSRESDNEAFYLDAIEYTSNEKQKMSPYNVVKFEYTQKDSSITYRLFSEGANLRSNKLLISIVTASFGRDVVKYVISYSESGLTKEPLVTSISECPPGEAVSRECYPPTKFFWNTDSTILPANRLIMFSSKVAVSSQTFGSTCASDSATSALDCSRLSFGDFNGDGLTDGYIITPSQDIMLLSEYRKFSSELQWHVTSGPNTEEALEKNELLQDINRIKLLDLNSDGYTDILRLDVDKSRAYLAKSVSPSSVTFDAVTAPGVETDEGLEAGLLKYFDGDFNGDGLIDIMTVSGNCSSSSNKLEFLIHFNKNNRVEFDPPVIAAIISDCEGLADETLSRILVADFNGDGKTDVSLLRNGLAALTFELLKSVGKELVSCGQASLSVDSPPDDSLSRLKFLDMNGDGLLDIMVVTGFDSNVAEFQTSPSTIYFSTGDGKFHKQPGIDFPRRKYQQKTEIELGRVLTGDINGDGFSDVLLINDVETGARLHVYFSTGNGFQSSIPSLPLPVSIDSLAEDLARIRVGDFNGDDLLDLYVITPICGQADVAYINLLERPVVKSLLDGVGVRHFVTYAPMTDTSVHSKGPQTSFPVGSSISGRLLVSKFMSVGGESQESISTYHYSGYKSHYQGLGSLGFEEITTTEVKDKLSNTQKFSQNWRRLTIGEWISEDKRIAGKLIQSRRRSITSLARGSSHKVYQVFSPKTVAKDYDLNGKLLTTTVSTVKFDRYNNPLTVTVETREMIEEEKMIQWEIKKAAYANVINEEVWLLGLVTRETVQASSTTVRLPVVRRSHYVYDQTSGQTIAEIKEPFSPTLRLVTTFRYDCYGNLVQTKNLWHNGSATDGRAKYDRLGRFKISQINSKGQKEKAFFDSGTGSLLSLTGPNGFASMYKYERLGNIIQRVHSDNSRATVTKHWCLETDVCPSEGAVAVTSTSVCGQNTTLVYDSLGRVVRTVKLGFKGRLIYHDTVYDATGNIARESNPYFKGETVFYTRFVYDLIGRPVKIVNPSGQVTIYRYKGLTTCEIDSMGGSTCKQRDSQGNIVRSTDQLGNTMRYKYDPFGNMIKIIDTEGNVMKMLYDVRGRKVEVSDPNAGESSYAYDALGQMTGQSDSSGAWLQTERDNLGRITKQHSSDSQTTIHYDNRNKGVGKASKIKHVMYKSASSKVVAFSYEENYSYDLHGRTDKITAVVNQQSFHFKQTYDYCGRTSEMLYPGGFGVRNVYESSSSLLKTVDIESGHSLWEAVQVAADGRVEVQLINSQLRTEARYDPQRHLTGIFSSWADSNGGVAQHLSLTVDPEGNLRRKRDVFRGLEEEAQYDKANRLVESRIKEKSKVTHALRLSYDSAGNILYKSDVGKYNYQYGPRPNAVSSVLFKDGTERFLTYDAAGRIWSGFGRTYTYTGSGKPKSIAHGSSEVVFGYDAEGGTVYRKDVDSDGRTLVTFSLGNFELQNEALDMICRYSLGSSLVRSYRCIHFDSHIKRIGKGETFYITRDHLGSVETLYSERKQVVEQQSFDAFGKARNSKNWLPFEENKNILNPNTVTLRSYARQQAIHVMGIMQCGFRLYDPVLGRFLSPDPSVADPSDSQAINPYSYINNNPLSGLDTSGLFVKRAFKRVVRHVKKVVNVAKKVAVKPAKRVAEKVAREAVRTVKNVGKVAEKAVRVTEHVVKEVVVKPVKALSKPLRPILKQSATALVNIAIASVIPGCSAFCFAAWSAIQAKLSGASWSDALQTGLLTYATRSIGKGDSALFTKTERILIGGTIHGAASKARGGSFTSGFLSGAMESGSAPTTWKDLKVDNFISGVGAVVKQTTHLYFQSVMRKAAISAAGAIGIDVDEMNLVLTGASFLFGSRTIDTCLDEDKKKWSFIRGISTHTNGNSVLGYTGDAIDALLLYQGLPSATGWNLISSGNYERVIGGHSLGSVEASVLLQYGFINHAILAANPIGQVSSLTKATLVQNRYDLVTGYTFELLQHPQAVIRDVPINKENAAGHGFKEVYVPILRKDFGLTFE